MFVGAGAAYDRYVPPDDTVVLHPPQAAGGRAPLQVEDLLTDTTSSRLFLRSLAAGKATIQAQLEQRHPKIASDPSLHLNALFQEAWRAPPSHERDLVLAALARDFASRASMFGRMIITELDQAPRTVEEVSPGKYEVAGIRFTLMSGELPSKMASHALKGSLVAFQAAELIQAELNSLPEDQRDPELVAALDESRVPLNCLVDFAGHRIVAYPLLPVPSDCAASECNGTLLKELAARLHVEPGPGVLCRRGNDDISYLFHCDNFLPRECSSPPHLPPLPEDCMQEGFAVRRLRPELLRRLAEAGADVTHEDMHAAEALLNDVIPDFARLFQSLVPDFADTRSTPWAHWRPAAVAMEFHSRGINMRHLGLVRSLLKPGTRASQVLAQEMVARAVKNMMRAMMRGVRGSSASSEMLFSLSEFINLFFAHHNAFWTQLHSAVVGRFAFNGVGVEPDPIKGVRNLTDACEMQLVSIAHHCLQRCGFGLASEFIQREQERVREFLARPVEDGTFTPPIVSPADIVEDAPFIKKMSVLDTLEASILRYHAESRLDVLTRLQGIGEEQRRKKHRDSKTSESQASGDKEKKKQTIVVIDGASPEKEDGGKEEQEREEEEDGDAKSSHSSSSSSSGSRAVPAVATGGIRGNLKELSSSSDDDDGGDAADAEKEKKDDEDVEKQEEEKQDEQQEEEQEKEKKEEEQKAPLKLRLPKLNEPPNTPPDSLAVNVPRGRAGESGLPSPNEDDEEPKSARSASYQLPGTDDELSDVEHIDVDPAQFSPSASHSGIHPIARERRASSSSSEEDAPSKHKKGNRFESRRRSDMFEEEDEDDTEGDEEQVEEEQEVVEKDGEEEEEAEDGDEEKQKNASKEDLTEHKTQHLQHDSSAVSMGSALSEAGGKSLPESFPELGRLWGVTAACYEQALLSDSGNMSLLIDYARCKSLAYEMVRDYEQTDATITSVLKSIVKNIVSQSTTFLRESPEGALPPPSLSATATVVFRLVEHLFRLWDRRRAIPGFHTYFGPSSHLALLDVGQVLGEIRRAVTPRDRACLVDARCQTTLSSLYMRSEALLAFRHLALIELYWGRMQTVFIHSHPALRPVLDGGVVPMVRGEGTEKISQVVKANADAAEHLYELLYNALCERDMRFSTLLLEMGLSINWRNEFGETLLMRAARNNDPETVRMLVTGGAAVNVTDRNGHTALVHAVLHGAVEALRALAEFAETDFERRYKQEQTVLHIAAASNRPETIPYLMSLDPNAEDAQHRTPLMLAALSNGTGCIKALCQSPQVDRDKMDRNNDTALTMAFRASKFEAMDALGECGANPDHPLEPNVLMLHKCAVDDNTQAAAVLLKHGANKKIKDVDGLTPFLISIERRSKGVLALLIEHDRLWSMAARKDGLRGVHIAASRGDNELVALLLEARKEQVNDTTSMSDKFRTPLMHAIVNGKLDTMRLLLKHGARPGEKDIKGTTCIQYAFQANQYHAALLLLEADPAPVSDERLIKWTIQKRYIWAAAMLNKLNSLADRGEGEVSAWIEAAQKGDPLDQNRRVYLDGSHMVSSSKAEPRKCLARPAELELKGDTVRLTVHKGKFIKKDHVFSYELTTRTRVCLGGEFAIQYGSRAEQEQERDVRRERAKPGASGGAAKDAAAGGIDDDQEGPLQASVVIDVRGDKKTTIACLGPGLVWRVETIVKAKKKAEADQKAEEEAEAARKKQEEEEAEAERKKLDSSKPDGQKEGDDDGDADSMGSGRKNASGLAEIITEEQLEKEAADRRAKGIESETSSAAGDSDSEKSLAMTVVGPQERPKYLRVTERDPLTNMPREMPTMVSLLSSSAGDVKRLRSVVKSEHERLTGLIKHRDTRVLKKSLDEELRARIAKGTSLLHEACYAGSQPVVEALLREPHFDPNQKNGHGMTLLHVECEEGQIRIVRVLLDAGANPDVTDSIGRTSLHVSARSGHVEIVRLLLERHASIHLRDQHERTPLFTALENAHTDVGEVLLDAGSDPDARNDEGSTALIKAAQAGRIEDVQLLLRFHANPDLVVEEDGRTAAMHAFLSGHVDVIDLLLGEEGGADPNIQEKLSARAILHEAADRGHVEVVKILLREGSRCSTALQDENEDTALHLACQKDHIDVVELLLAHSHDEVNARNKVHETPLHGACKNKRTELVRQLLAAGADANAADTQGTTALHLSAGSGDLPTVRVLLEAKANPNAQNESGTTPLYDAAISSFEDTVKALLAAGADPNARDGRQRSMLHAAAEDNFQSVLRILLEAKADVNVADPDGVRPLHLAIERSNEDCCKLLVEAGADVNAAVTKDGRMPLMIAIEQRLPHTIELLCAKGADVAHTDAKSGKNIMELAIESLHWQSVEALLRMKADPNHVYEEGRETPLLKAIHTGNADLVRAILKGGGDSTMRDAEGNSALFRAVFLGFPEVVRVLAECGADMHETDAEGENAVHWAVEFDHADVIDVLIEAGCDPNLRTFKHRTTPLHRAAGKGNSQVVAALLKGKADVNVFNKHNTTPLHRAAKKAFRPVVEQLLEAGADLYAKDSDKRTPFDVTRDGTIRELMRNALKKRQKNAPGTPKTPKTPGKKKKKKKKSTSKK